MEGARQSWGYPGFCFHLLPGLNAWRRDHTKAGPWVCWASLLPANSSGKHMQQCSDLCISIGVSGTACSCCWNRKESYLEPDQSRAQGSLHRAEYPQTESTEVAAHSMAFPGGARTGYIELLGFSTRAHQWPVAPNTRAWAPDCSLYQLVSWWQTCLSQGNRAVNAYRTGFRWQIWVAEMCGAKSKVWVWELSVGG